MSQLPPAVVAVYALACLLIVAASFGPVVLAGLVCVLLPLVAAVAWRRA